MLLWAAALACPDASEGLHALEQAVLELDLAAADDQLTALEATLGCRWIPSSSLARMWTAEGAFYHHRDEHDAARLAFAAAHRVQPGFWAVDYGSKVRTVYDHSLDLTLGGARVDLDVGGEGWDVRVDGGPMSLPADLPAGLHLVQVGEMGGNPRFGVVVEVLAGSTTTVSTGLVKRATTGLVDGEGARRIRELQQALQDGKTAAVEHQYIELITEHPLALPPAVHRAGATAARDRGDLLSAWRRLRRVSSDGEGGPEAVAEREALESATGMVYIESRGPLARTEALLDPTLTRAVQRADQLLQDTGFFEGLLPVGTYTLAGESVTVTRGRSVQHIVVLP